MGKVGRNELCPCDSGKKFKRCCLIKRQSGQKIQSVPQANVSLMLEVGKIRDQAKNNKQIIKELGVFILYSNTEGDAWLFEITESDAVQLAIKGEPIDAAIDENPETIEVDWSHSFEVKNKQLVLNPYKKSHQEVCFDHMATQQLSASMRRIRKKCTPEQLNQVHVKS